MFFFLYNTFAICSYPLQIWCYFAAQVTCMLTPSDILGHNLLFYSTQKIIFWPSTLHICITDILRLNVPAWTQLEAFWGQIRKNVNVLERALKTTSWRVQGQTELLLKATGMSASSCSRLLPGITILDTHTDILQREKALIVQKIGTGASHHNIIVPIQPNVQTNASLARLEAWYWSWISWLDITAESLGWISRPDVTTRYLDWN